MNMILATDKNFMIAKDGYMPWKSSEDLKLFKKLTHNNNIIMGKTTFMSLPKRLENRQYFVLTRDVDYKKNEAFYSKVKETEAIVITDISFFENTNFNKEYNDNFSSDKIKNAIRSADNFVIGGAEIYNQFLEKKLINKVFWSKINTEIEPNKTSVYCNFLKHYDFKYQTIEAFEDFYLYILER